MKTRRNKPSLFGRIFAKFLLFAALITALLWCVQSLFFDTLYKSVKIKNASEALDGVVRNIYSDGEVLEDTVGDIGTYYNVCVIVLDERFGVLSNYECVPRCALHSLTRGQLSELCEAAYENGGYLSEEWELLEATSTMSRFSEKTSVFTSENIIKAAVVTSDSGSSRIALVNARISPLSETLSTLRILLAGISAAVFLLAPVFAFFISRSISRPISELRRAAVRLERGEFDVAPPPDSGCREIDELSDAFVRAASELSKAENLRRELIANVSHDLRTPLTTIGGTAELMRDFADERTDENIDVISAEAGRLSGLVSDMMELSKLQSKSEEYSFADFSLTEVIGEVARSASALARQKGYAVEVETQGDAVVTGDRRRIEQVLHNLCANAVNYLGDGSSVKLTQTIEGDRVRVDVSDDGEGISQEDLPHIFERYYRSSRPHKRSTDGSGLGLSIVKTILDAHGAAYGVLSSPGKGSDFWFSLKLARSGSESGNKSSRKP